MQDVNFVNGIKIDINIPASGNSAAQTASIDIQGKLAVSDQATGGTKTETIWRDAVTAAKSWITAASDAANNESNGFWGDFSSLGPGFQALMAMQGGASSVWMALLSSGKLAGLNDIVDQLARQFAGGQDPDIFAYLAVAQFMQSAAGEGATLSRSLAGFGLISTAGSASVSAPFLGGLAESATTNIFSLLAQVATSRAMNVNQDLQVWYALSHVYWITSGTGQEIWPDTSAIGQYATMVDRPNTTTVNNVLHYSWNTANSSHWPLYIGADRSRARSDESRYSGIWWDYY